MTLGEWSVCKWVTSSVDRMPTSTTGRQVPATSRHKEDMERRKFVQSFLRDLPKLPSHCCRAEPPPLKNFWNLSSNQLMKFTECSKSNKLVRFQVFTEEFHRMYTLACTSCKKTNVTTFCIYSWKSITGKL